MHGLFIIGGDFIGRRVARDAAGLGLLKFLVEHSDPWGNIILDQSASGISQYYSSALVDMIVFWLGEVTQDVIETLIEEYWRLVIGSHIMA